VRISMHRFRETHTQRGTAIFMALFVVVLVTSFTVIWFMQNRLGIRMTQQMLISDQSYLYIQGVVDWAIDVITQDAMNNTETHITKYPKLLPEIFTAENGVIISGRIDDYQARLNINRLTEPETQKAFLRLMTILGNSSDPAIKSRLVDAIIAWTTPIGSLTPAMAALDRQYTNNRVPYRAANRPMQSISELSQIEGITPETFLLLKPYISALAPTIPMTFTNADPAILSAFNMSSTTLSIVKPSEYYLVQANLEFSDHYLVFYTLLHRTITHGKINVGIVWQSRGTL
jgi:general secretion pathway protein K